MIKDSSPLPAVLSPFQPEESKNEKEKGTFLSFEIAYRLSLLSIGHNSATRWKEDWEIGTGYPY